MTSIERTGPRPHASLRTHQPTRSLTTAGAGGFDVLADPDRTGLDVFVYWRADALARHVRLAAAPDSIATESLVRFEPDRWGGRQAGRSTLDGYHLILAPAIGVEHHLFFADADPPSIGTPLMPQPSFDAWHPERLEATLAFWRFAQNPRSSPAPRVKPPRPSGKTLEFAFLAWALDLKRQGATDHELTRALFGEMPFDWEDSGLRSQVRRLVAKARAYATGGYRRLLMPRRRPLRRLS